MSKEIYKLIIEPLTCVHIGSGEDLTPLDYLVKEVNKKTLYLTYESDLILKQIALDKVKLNEFNRITESNDMKSLADFFHKEFNFDVLKYPCETTKEFEKNYRENSGKDPLQNGRFVKQMYRPEGSKHPVIPGSSLKGAIRTAILNHLMYGISNEDYDKYYDELKNVKNKAKFESKLQSALLEHTNAKNDPFRAVEIGDCEFEAKGTQLVGIVKNIACGKDGEVKVFNSSNVQAEVIEGKFCKYDNTLILGETDIRINKDLSCKDLPEQGVSKKIEIEDIVKACNYFYLREFEREYEKFYKEASDSNVNAITKLYKELKNIVNSNTNNFILRVGRWSQVEFVTYEENFRHPETPRNKKTGQPYGWGNTRWIFDNDGEYLPLGWCKCSVEEV